MLIQLREKNIFLKKEIFFWEIIEKIKLCTSQHEALFCAYTEISQKYHWDRIKTLTRFHQLFIQDTKKLEKMSWFLHCTNLNFILKYVCVKSGWFQEEDFSYKWTVIWGFSPHQYIEVSNIKVDLWAKIYGITYGDYARFFHQKS